MLKKYLYNVVVLCLILSFGCSSSEQSTDEDETNDEVYVFDEVPLDTTVEINQPEPKTLTKKVSHYLIQIGAFTTREKAELFANSSRRIITDDIEVFYNHEVNLFVVRLSENFRVKNDAVSKRDRIRLFEEFKDAWIITVY